MSATRFIIRARSAMGTRRQWGKAAAALASLASISAGVSRVKARIVSPVAGLMLAIWLARRGRTCRPGLSEACPDTSPSPPVTARIDDLPGAQRPTGGRRAEGPR